MEQSREDRRTNGISPAVSQSSGFIRAVRLVRLFRIFKCLNILVMGLVGGQQHISDDQWWSAMTPGNTKVVLGAYAWTSQTSQNVVVRQNVSNIRISVEDPPAFLSSPAKAGAIFHRLKDDDGSAEHHGWKIDSWWHGITSFNLLE